MKRNFLSTLTSFLAILLLAFVFTACGGGGGGTPTSNYTPPGSTAPITTTTSAAGYSVTYNANGGIGTAPVDSKGYPAGQSVTVSTTSGTLTYSGFTFVGWQTKADGSGTTYAQGQTFNMGSSNVTLYALWAGGYAYVVDQNSGSAGIISQYAITPNGALSPLSPGTVQTSGTNSQLITTDPSGKYVYVTNLSSNNVSQFTVGPTGALTLMATPTVLVGTAAGVYYPFGITVHPSDKWAYVAINQRGIVNQYAISTTGALTPLATPTVAAGAYPDSVTVDPSGRFAYVANGDANNVSQYTIDQTTGALVPLPTATVAAGLNAYTVTVDPQGKHAYVTSYSKGTISQYDINQTTGALTPMAIPTVASGATGAISITIDPRGKFAYVTLVPSSPNAVIAQFTIDQTTGALTPMPTSLISAGGAAAVRIAIESSGKFAYATCGNSGYGSSTVAQFTIDQTTGALTLMPNPTVITGAWPNGIVTVGK